MHIQDVFKWVPETFSNVIGFLLGRVVEGSLGKFTKEKAGEVVEQTAEKVWRENWAYLQYRLTGRVPPLIDDVYQLAMVQIQNQWPNEAFQLARRVTKLDNVGKGRFRIAAVIPQRKDEEEERKKAIQTTMDVLRYYARMPKEQWEHEITNLNIKRDEPPKTSFWQRVQPEIIGDITPVKTLANQFLTEIETDLT